LDVFQAADLLDELPYPGCLAPEDNAFETVLIVGMDVGRADNKVTEFMLESSDLLLPNRENGDRR